MRKRKIQGPRSKIQGPRFKVQGLERQAGRRIRDETGDASCRLAPPALNLGSWILDLGSSSAFTLVEILASLLFLAIAVPAIVGASLAGELAENKLNEMLTDNAWQTAAQANGDFGDAFPLYHWQMTTQTWAGGGTSGTGAASTPAPITSSTGTNSLNGSASASTLTELTVEVTYPVRGAEHTLRLTTLVNPSITTTSTTGGTSSSTTTTK